MSKAKHTDGLTTQERKDLEELGYVEGNVNTIPENISPVLKSKIMEAHKKENDLTSPLDMPNAIETANQYARERAAADGDKEMQKVTGVEEGAKTAKRQNDI